MAIQFAKEQQKSAARPKNPDPKPKSDRIDTAVKRGRGRPPSGNETVTLRISSDVLAFYRSKGKGWQAMINEDLKAISTAA